MAETCRKLLAHADACECNRETVRCQKEICTNGLFALVWEIECRLYE
jgi:hypothetical protein